MSETGYVGYEGWKKWSVESFGKFSRADAVYYDAEISRTGISIKRGLQVFEIGFGNGTFAGWAQSRGFDYTGSELITDLLNRAQSCGIRVFGADDDVVTKLGAESQDLVVAFDVLEHLDLEAIQSTLKVMRRLLKHGGCILARVPSGDSPFGRAIFHGDLTHKIALGSSAVGQLAAICDYELLVVGEPKLPMFGVGLKSGFKRMLVKGARSITSGLINVVFHDAQPRVITSNLMFVLRKSTG